MQRSITLFVALMSWLTTEATSVLTDVFTSGLNGYACYRIPALLVLSNGTYIAFAEARKYSCADHGYVDLASRASDDGGVTWGRVNIIHSESGPQNVTIGNPAPVQLANGDVLLPFCRNNVEWGTLRYVEATSEWMLAYQDTPSECPWVATGPPGSLQLPSGRIVVPMDCISSAGVSSSSTFISDDDGVTWALSNSVIGGNECQAAPMPWVSPSTLLLSMRSSNSTTRLASISSDDGTTWSASWSTIHEIECEASTISLPTHPGGPLLVMSSAFDASARANLTLHTSPDGHAWTPRALVYAGSAAYSALTTLNATTVGLLFERDDYTAITFTAVTL